MKLLPEHRVDMETAQARAMSALKKRETVPASYVAGFIWPDHSMKAQGAGAAATRILKHLERQGKVRWFSNGSHWGWKLT